MSVIIRELPVSRYRRHQRLGTVRERLRQRVAYENLIRRGYMPDVAAFSYVPEEGQETKSTFLDPMEDAVVLHDDRTVQTKLDQLRARMRVLGSRKIVLDGGTYDWLVKPGLRFGEVIE